MIALTNAAPAPGHTSRALFAVRLIPLPVHAALRMLTGLATMLAPFALGFEAPAMVMAVLVGALVTGVALSTVADERGRTALPVSAVHALDYGLALGLLAVAAVVAGAGDTVAGSALGAIALVQLAGNAMTTYTARG
ncbi:MAG: hypothetical protein JWO90_3308 [Solirubrobacterales bacterium]|nr:hypothetical protein [Solirubrobacterales bacterium]